MKSSHASLTLQCTANQVHLHQSALDWSHDDLTVTLCYHRNEVKSRGLFKFSSSARVLYKLSESARVLYNAARVPYSTTITPIYSGYSIFGAIIHLLFVARSIYWYIHTYLWDVVYPYIYYQLLFLLFKEEYQVTYNYLIIPFTTNARTILLSTRFTTSRVNTS